MDLFILRNMIPKFNARKHAKKKVYGGQKSNSLLLSSKEQNEEEEKETKTLILSNAKD